MKKVKGLSRYLLFFLLAFTFALAGCKGDTGARGPAGPTGPTGPITPTGEACAVCHGSGAIADVANFMGPTATAPAPQLAVTINSVTAGTVGADPAIVTNFTASGSSSLFSSYFDPTTGVAANNGAGNLSYLRFAYASLAPAAVTGDTPLWQTYTDADRATADLVCGAPVTNPDSTLSVTCTMTTDVAAAVTGGAAYDATLRTRVLLVVSGISGTSSANDVFQDFVPDGTTAPLSRDVVPETACNQCHRNLDVFGIFNLDDGYVHGASRYLVEACVVCHTANNVPAPYVFPTLVHQIHNAVDASGAGGIDFSVVTYPAKSDVGIPDCTHCHYTDTDTTTYPTGYGQNSANYQNFPTAAACGSCHPDVVDANTNPNTAHPGGQQPDSNCSACHPAAGSGVGMSVATAHDQTPRLITIDPTTGAAANEDNRPEFIVHISMTAPANGNFYVTGEKPIVTVTLTKANPDGTDSGTAVDGTVYKTPSTDATSAVGVAGGGLSSAELFVYGSRAKALPVLTTNSSTDSNLAAGTAPTQGHSLRLGAGGISTDPLVMTDLTGYKYQLEAIPASLADGTYMVQFQGSDYGGVSSTDYVTGSTGLITFNVNTDATPPATVTDQLKVTGDGCYNCHGTISRMHQGGTHAHDVPFDTDYCLACHDQSLNHGVPIANRVHAVHDANSAGDLENIGSPGSRNWDAITFPQDDQACVMCHTNYGAGETTFLTKPYEVPCYGCHADSTDAVFHMEQNGGPYGPGNPYP